jgi:hypothetical protein
MPIGGVVLLEYDFLQLGFLLESQVLQLMYKLLDGLFIILSLLLFGIFLIFLELNVLGLEDVHLNAGHDFLNFCLIMLVGQVEDVGEDICGGLHKKEVLLVISVELDRGRGSFRVAPE